MATEEIITPNGTVIAALPKKADTLLVRNHDMVHLKTCWRVETRIVNPWRWAEGLSVSEIASAAQNGLKFCRSCKPLEVLGELQTRASVARGLAQSAAGETVDLGDFTQYAGTERLDSDR